MEVSPTPPPSTLLIFLLLTSVFSLKETIGDKILCLFYLSLVPWGFICALHLLKLVPCGWHISKSTLFSWLIANITTLHSSTSDISWFLLGISVHCQAFYSSSSCPLWDIAWIPQTDYRTVTHCSFLETLCLYTVIFDHPEIQPTTCHLWTFSHAGLYLPSLLQKHNLKGLPRMWSLNKTFQN